jgi:transketolase
LPADRQALCDFLNKERNREMTFTFGPRRGVYVDILDEMKRGDSPLSLEEVQHLERFDLFYRSLCAMLFNYVPTSGHPGGSISSGRFVTGILFDTLDYDVSQPNREDADIISYAAGHKALGLYSLWALRNEVLRIGKPDLLPADERYQIRLEDLLGFRRNPVTNTPLFKKLRVKALDGHPTPATPFVRLSTGASGVGLGSSIGLALGALDYFGKDAPYVHIVEGEGGMTPGRVYEALAAAGTSSLKNVILHVDWNQASIDSNRVCREGEIPGDYVQWNPMELAYLHDWNVIWVPEGRDFHQILTAQRKAKSIDNGQPTAIVYRTFKGWQYGVEGKASHGAGHKLCADGFYEALKPFLKGTEYNLPQCEAANQRCEGGKETEILEECFWEALKTVRAELEKSRPVIEMLARRLIEARDRLNQRSRKPRANHPVIDTVYEIASREGKGLPEGLKLVPGAVTTLRAELGRVLNYYNKASGGALLSAAADLLGSTSVNTIAKGFPEGYYNAVTNPGARLLSIGGICEDAIAATLSGLSSFGHNIGVGSSYGAFLAPLGHIAARLHAIGNQARQAIVKAPYRPMILVCAHAGLKTGEDGPTHADPQALQLLQENFPRGTMITLTPWDPQEIWVLVSTALAKRPAIIAPFVTRPNEKVVDRKVLGLAPVTSASSGVYLLRAAKGKRAGGTVVLQGSEVCYAFIEEALPLIEKEGIDLNVYYVASAELFDLLTPSQQERIYPEKLGEKAMGITGFTLPTMYRWIRSERGRRMILHPFQKGHYLGSGQANMVVKEAGLDGRSQFKAIKKYLEKR